MAKTKPFLLFISLLIGACLIGCATAPASTDVSPTDTEAAAPQNDSNQQSLAQPSQVRVAVQAYGELTEEEAGAIETTLNRAGYEVSKIDNANYSSPFSKTVIIARDETCLSFALDIAEAMDVPSSRVSLNQGGYNFTEDVLVLVGVL